MKYIVYVVLLVLIFILLLPIILITWDDNGMFKIQDGVKEICGIKE